MRKFITFCILCCSAHLSAQVVHNMSNNPIPVCQTYFQLKSYENNMSAPDAAMRNSCLGELTWSSSVWLSVQIDEPGDFSFQITPELRFDDIDFVVYKAKESRENAGFTLMRCMTSVVRLDRDLAEQPQCQGLTGLKMDSMDKEEVAGCTHSDDNFLAPIHARSGDRYLILVTNCNSAAGFDFEMTGSASIDDEKCRVSTTTLTVETNDFIISDLHPNPVHDRAYIDIQMASSEEVKLQVTRIDGSILYKRLMYLPKGKFQLMIPARKLPPGIYVARVIVGSKEYVTKFLKN